jgi:hypothetical protein
MEEQRIYVVVAGTVQVPAPRRSVVQPPGRQIAQACHAVSKLRHVVAGPEIQYGIQFEPMTTIVLQARDSAELSHIQILLLKKKLTPAVFFDTNDSVYGPGATVMTALAVFATKKQIENILDYLPLWGT